MTKVNVGPKVKNPTHDLSLEGDNFLWGLKLDGGVRGMQEMSQSPSTLMVGAGGKKWGTGDPTFTEIEQSSWHGGRGGEFFSDDETKYLDAWQAMTRVPGRLMPGLQWQFSEGYRYADQGQSPPDAWGSFSWKQLRGTSRYISVSFPASAAYDADKVYIWLRRRGSPGTLTLEFCSNSSGDPGTVQKTVTVTTSDVTDTLSVFKKFDWTTTYTTVATTTYHIKVYGASTDTAANHWEVAVDTSGSSSKTSSDGSAWTAASFSMYFRVVAADVDCKWHLFTISGYFMAIRNNADAHLYEWNETTDYWDEVTANGTLDSGDAISGTLEDVVVANDIAHFARGTEAGDETIFTMTNVAGATVGQDDATAGNKADQLLAYYDSVDGYQIARFENDNYYWSRSPVKAINTDLVFGTDVAFPKVAGISMAYYNDQVWVRTLDGLWSIKNDRPVELNVGLSAVREPSTSDGAMLAKDLFLYLAWSYSIERLYGGTLDDIGPWKGAGLPDGRQGVISCMCSGIGGVYVGIDAGSANTSSVLFYDGQGYEEVFRAWETGQRVRNIYYQPQNGTTSPARLWISVGGDLVYIALPDQSMNPLKDSDSRFVHEYSITSGIHDFGAAHLPKFFKALELSTENLGSSCDIGVDYQVDGDVGTSTWTELTTLYQSPYDAADLNLGNRKRIRYRLRCNTSAAATPPIVNAAVLTGFARTKLKRQWNLRVKAADLQRTRTGGKDHSWPSFYAFIQDAAKQADDFVLHSPEAELDGLHVVLDAPTVFRKFVNTIQKWVGGSFAITVREA